MSISFQCSSCQKSFKASRDQAGKKGKCPACGALVRIPQQQTTERKKQRREARLDDAPRRVKSPTPADQRLTITCPDCGETYHADSQRTGRSFRCKCGSSILIASSPEVAVTEEIPVPAGEPHGPLMSPSPTANPPTFSKPATGSAFQQAYGNQKRVQQELPGPEPPAEPAAEEEQTPRAPKGDPWRGPLALGGISLMVMAALLFLSGSATGFLFFYVPVFFLSGLGIFCQGLLRRK